MFGGVKIPKVLAAGITQRSTQVAAVEGEDARLGALLSRVASFRMKPVERPLYDDGTDMDPVLPQDLTRLNDQELGALYTEFCAMVQWVGYRHGLAVCLRAKLEIEFRRVKSRSYLQQSGNREEKAARSDIDSAVVAAEDDFLLAQNLESLTYPILQAYLTGKEATSREITRRQGAEWGERRGMGNAAYNHVPSRR